MKIGYPCFNYSIKGQTNKTFRLASYSKERFLETVRNNLDYLHKILQFNKEQGIGFFRISSEIIPFASHSVMDVPWQKLFRADLSVIGKLIKENRMRISMHPDQFVLINSPQEKIVQASVNDLIWHAELLEILGLDSSAKIQIHVGGVYGDRKEAIRRFIANYFQLPSAVKERLVIENDDKCFPLSDCMKIHEAVGIPILFDQFHHQCLNNGETMFEAMMSANSTWNKQDGLMMVDYSTQQKGAVKGRHADTIDLEDFKDFILKSDHWDFDVMLEIKDKEQSALKARDIISELKGKVIRK